MNFLINHFNSIPLFIVIIFLCGIKPINSYATFNNNVYEGSNTTVNIYRTCENVLKDPLKEESRITADYNENELSEQEPDSSTINKSDQFLSNIKEFLQLRWDDILIGLIISIIIIIFGILVVNPIKSVIKKVIIKYAINYSRYLKYLRQRLLNEAAYHDYPNIKLSSYTTNAIMGDNYTQQNLQDLTEVIENNDAIHILGKPGSGKTSMLKKFTLDVISTSKPPKIPIYLEYRGKDLFEQIVQVLKSNCITKKPELITITWLEDQLSKGKFIIIVDDVHSFMLNDKEKNRSRIVDLLDFNKNKFILSSRDYFYHSPFGMKIFEVNDLSQNDDLTEQILKVHTSEDKAEQIWQIIRFDEKLRTLYSTPQLIKMLATIFDPRDRLRDNRSILFKCFFEYRHMQEENKYSDTIPITLKKYVLGIVAFRALSKDTYIGYSVPYQQFRKILVEGVKKIQEEIGYTNYSVDTIETGLLKEGYIIKYEDIIKYEHDQWQEFFAALEIYNSRRLVTQYITGNQAHEVAYFISGFYLPPEQRKQMSYWKEFWGDIVSYDLFLTERCLNSRGMITADEIVDAFKGYTFSDKDLHSAYSEVLNWYREIIHKYFPKLIKHFAPYEEERDIGIIVERNNNNNTEYWYGYRSINPEEHQKVKIVDQNEIMRLIKGHRPEDNLVYYENKYNVKYLHSWMDGTAVHEPPVLVAYRDVRNQLTKLVKSGKLVDSTLMKQEALYNEAVALSKILTGRYFSYSNLAEQFVLPIRDLLSGLEDLRKNKINRSFNVPGSSYAIDGLPDREVSYDDIERQLQEYLSEKDINDNITNPNEDILEVVNKYRWDKDQLTNSDREYLIQRSKKYFKDLYSNYKYVIENSFPETKGSFKKYSGFPIKIYLVKMNLDNSKVFGEYHLFFNVNGLSDWCDVELIDVSDMAKLKQQFSEYTGYLGYWGFESFSRVEPIRNAVYKLIKSEYEGLIDR